MNGFNRPQTLISVASYVEREYGNGYMIRPQFGALRWGLFEVIHGDGSRFDVIADEYGNAETLLDASRSVAIERFRRNAVAA